MKGMPGFFSLDEINHDLFHPHEMKMYDSLGNEMKMPPAYDKSIPQNLFDSNSYNLVEANQLFYIEQGKLYSYIPFVSPKMSINTSTGIFLGLSNYFSTSFNYSYNYKPKHKNKLVSLGQTKRLVLQDSMYVSGKLKELYGRDLIKTLWPYIMNEKLKLANVET